jgi:hypothetical protein
MKINKEKQLVEKTINLDDLSGCSIQEWITKLTGLRDTLTSDGYINVYAYYENVTVEFDYKILETDKEYDCRIQQEMDDYKREQKRKQAEAEQLKKAKESKRLELEKKLEEISKELENL